MIQFYSTGTAAGDVIDLSDSADTTNHTFEAPRAGKVLLNLSWARVTEAIGTMTSTTGVGSIEVAGTEVATITPTASDAIGESYALTEDSSVDDDHIVPFSAGDDIEFICKTQASGGTTTGELEVMLATEWANV